MGMMANIVCKTVGIAGLSSAVYDAYCGARHHAQANEQDVIADSFEKIHDNSRSMSTVSGTTNIMQKKLSNFRMDNPIFPMIGKVTGFIKGAFSSLGSNILLVSSASIALATKGFMSKLGAWGVAAVGAYKVLHEGFGLGKKTPIDE